MVSGIINGWREPVLRYSELICFCMSNAITLIFELIGVKVAESLGRLCFPLLNWQGFIERLIVNGMEEGFVI